jgi:hypothetical protein
MEPVCRRGCVRGRDKPVSEATEHPISGKCKVLPDWEMAVTEIPVQFRLGIAGCKPQDLAGTGGPPDEEAMHGNCASLLVGKVLDICLCDTAGIATDRPLVYGKRQGITQSRWPNYCDQSVTSADVRLSVGPNLSRAACPRPVDLASPRRGLVTHQNATPLRWIVDTLTPCLKDAR